MQNQENEIYASDPDRIYIAVGGPKNSNGDDPQLPGAGLNGWTVTYVSKSCKDPEKAIRLLTYLISEEGQKMTYLGVEGKMYDEVDGKIVTKEGVSKLLNADRAEYDRVYGADNTYWMLQDNVAQLKWSDGGRTLPGALREWTRDYTVYAGQYDIVFPEESDEAQIDRRIEEVWGQTLPQLLLAESDEQFDEIMEEYRLKRDSLGYGQWQEAATGKMNQTKEKLGLQ